jgi:hypothetical protein
MIPQYVGYDLIPLYDAMNKMIGVKVVYGTRYFVWEVDEDEQLAHLVLIH